PGEIRRPAASVPRQRQHQRGALQPPARRRPRVDRCRDRRRHRVPSDADRRRVDVTLNLEPTASPPMTPTPLPPLRRHAAALALVPPAAPMAQAQSGGVPATEPATVIGSYGEINYNRPTHAGQDAQADLRRFVLGLQHRLDPKTKVVAELEVEHAVSSSSDA